MRTLANMGTDATTPTSGDTGFVMGGCLSPTITKEPLADDRVMPAGRNDGRA